jgi:hypothetical protein
VLLAFAVFVVWESFREAEATVMREAGAVASLYRLASPLDGEARSAIEAALEGYLTVAIAQDWPAMDAGAPGSEAGARALSAAYAAAIGWQPANGREEVILGAFLDQLDALTEARRERLGLAAGVVPELVWSALVIGAVLTIAFTFFFAAESLAAQMLMSGMLALTLALSLLVVVALDRPFAGAVRVSVAPLEQVLADGRAGALSLPVPPRR